MNITAGWSNSCRGSHSAPHLAEIERCLLHLCLSTEDSVQYYLEPASPAINSVLATHDVCSFAGSKVKYTEMAKSHPLSK
jgi:hypothetical protein